MPAMCGMCSLACYCCQAGLECHLWYAMKSIRRSILLGKESRGYTQRIHHRHSWHAGQDRVHTDTHTDTGLHSSLIITHRPDSDPDRLKWNRNISIKRDIHSTGRLPQKYLLAVQTDSL